MTDQSPFHAGEQKFQTQLGVRDTIEPWARKVVRGALPEQHREFYAELPFLAAAARDDAGRPWATLLTGPRGFAHSPHPKVLRINGAPPAHDPLADSLRDGADLGLLGLEFSSRRRNRLNGRIGEKHSAGFELEVGQAFGNCPQYIHEREWREVEVEPAIEAPPRHTSPHCRIASVESSKRPTRSLLPPATGAKARAPPTAWTPLTAAAIQASCR
jgi:predicted pyridoxine 5'-phosphate oxidase superfamily flavin-nucleotide-binding protein